LAHHDGTDLIDVSARHTGTGAVGLVLARPLQMLSAEPFFMEFISGIEERLSIQDRAVVLHMVTTHEEEIATYRRWEKQGLVDAVAVVNLTSEDRRPAVLRELGLPAVLVGTWKGDPDLPTVATDDTSPMREALDRLLDLGHRRIARISGPPSLLHTRARTSALSEGAREAGIDPPVVVEGDYSHESGEQSTIALLSREEPPTAILYDNGVMAVAGPTAARTRGVASPARGRRRRLRPRVGGAIHDRAPLPGGAPDRDPLRQRRHGRGGSERGQDTGGVHTRPGEPDRLGRLGPVQAVLSTHLRHERGRPPAGRPRRRSGSGEHGGRYGHRTPFAHGPLRPSRYHWPRPWAMRTALNRWPEVPATGRGPARHVASAPRPWL